VDLAELLVDRLDLREAVVEPARPRGGLDPAAAVGELVRAERRGVRFEGVGRTADLVRRRPRARAGPPRRAPENP
jgi:hypothetical protein